MWRMKKSKIIRVTSILLFGCLSIWWLSSASLWAGPRAKTVLKFGTVAPDGTSWAKVMRRIDSDLQKKTKGELRFEYGFGGMYGGESELVRLCREGKVAMIGVSTTIVANILPELNLVEMPYLFRSSEEADFAVDNILDREIGPKLEARGLVVMQWGDNGFKSLATLPKKVLSPSDLKGMTLRAQESEIYRLLFNALGAKTVKLNVKDVARGLQSGMVDGFDNTPLFTYSSGFHHYIKYFTLTEHTYQPVLLLVSKKVYDRLPKAHRDALFDDRDKFKQTLRKLVRRSQPVALKKLEEAGVKVIRLNPSQKAAFEKAAEPVYDKADELLGKDGARLLKRVRNELEKRRSR